jgi:hypothetical protein
MLDFDKLYVLSGVSFLIPSEFLLYVPEYNKLPVIFEKKLDPL